MKTVKALVRQAELNTAVVDAVNRARQSMMLIHLGEIPVGDYVIDLTEDIQRLSEVLILLGHSDRV